MNSFIKSPFMYISKPKIKFFNKKGQTSISYKKFDKLSSEGTINTQHYDILRLLFDYRYLTTSTIDSLLKSKTNDYWIRFTDEERKGVINSSLSLLRDNGLVEHSTINWESDENNNRKRTPGYYRLTKGGVACIKRLWTLEVNIEEYSKELPASIILKELAINQMIANYKLKAQYLDNIILNKQIKSEKIKKWFNLHTILTMKKDGNVIQFIVEPVRRDTDWKKNIIIKMSILYSILKVNSIERVDSDLVESPAIVLLCEDVPHAKECFSVLHDRVPMSENLFFTTDASQLSPELINSLMKIKMDDGSISLMEYEVSYLS